LARILLILVFLCQHIALAAEPIVVHLPDGSHATLLSLTQPSGGSSHHHDETDCRHQSDIKNTAASTPSAASATSEPQDSSSHDHAKHLHGHADLPSQQFLFATVLAGNESYLHHSQLTGITHTPPVPPPNA